jgi:hypothetical protein
MSRDLSDKEAYSPKASQLSQAQQISFENPTKISKPRRRAKKHHLKFLGPAQDKFTTTSSKTISPLLRLPGEIRNLIYFYTLTSPTSALVYNASEMRFETSGIGLGLLSSCHAIALETQHLHFKLNTLLFALGNGEALRDREMTTILRGLARLACAKGWRFQIEIKLREGDTARVAILVRSRKS